MGRMRFEINVESPEGELIEHMPTLKGVQRRCKMWRKKYPNSDITIYDFASGRVTAYV